MAYFVQVKENGSGLVYKNDVLPSVGRLDSKGFDNDHYLICSLVSEGLSPGAVVVCEGDIVGDTFSPVEYLAYLDGSIIQRLQLNTILTDRVEWLV